MKNEMIAEKVMGWEKTASNAKGCLWWCPNKKQHYGETDFLTDMNATMMVIAKMREKGFKLSIADDLTYGNKSDVYVVAFHEPPHCINSYRSKSESLPTAICTAALKAMEAL